MCKAKRMTCAELEDKIIDHAKRSQHEIRAPDA